MPISFFLGPPRTGKTYEAVMSQVVPAALAGRRIVTNIPLRQDELREYVSAKRSKGSDVPECEVVVVSTAQLQDPESYPWDPEGEYIPGSIVMPGDLVVIDEAHVVFPQDVKIQPRLAAFFRVHGHFFNDETGMSIDIVIITQDANTLRPEFKYLGEMYMKVRPIRGKVAGKYGSYKAAYFTSVSLTESNMYGKPQVRRIKGEIVGLYKSFTHGKGGVTKKQDGRARLLSPGMIVYFSIGVLSFCYSIYAFWGGPSFMKSPEEKKVVKHDAGSDSKLVQSGPCYDAGIFIDGRWNRIGPSGEFEPVSVGPTEACRDQGKGSPFGLGGGSGQAG